MSLSKAFDTLNHDLLIVKLGAYGFETDALRHMKRYLTNRKEKVTVNETFSEWERITTGVPQDSISGPLLLNIVLNDLLPFVLNSFLSNYVDDNTLYTFGNNLKEIKIIYEAVLIQCINDFTKIIWCLTKENVILCVSGKNRKRSILIQQHRYGK